MRELARTVHRNAEGSPVLTYVPGTVDGHPAAYAVEVIGPDTVDSAVDSILTDLSGWTVTCSAELASRLATAGAITRRHFHIMRRPLASNRPPPAWSESDLGPGRREVPC